MLENGLLQFRDQGRGFETHNSFNNLLEHIALSCKPGTLVHLLRNVAEFFR